MFLSKNRSGEEERFVPSQDAYMLVQQRFTPRGWYRSWIPHKRCGCFLTFQRNCTRHRVYLVRLKNTFLMSFPRWTNPKGRRTKLSVKLEGFSHLLSPCYGIIKGIYNEWCWQTVKLLTVRNTTGLARTAIKLRWSQKLILAHFLAVNIDYELCWLALI